MKKELVFFNILIMGILSVSLISAGWWSDSQEGDPEILDKKSASYLMRATNFKTEMGIDKVTFQYKKNGAWTDVRSDAKEGDTFQLENLEFKVGPVNKEEKTVELTIEDGYFNRIINIEREYIMLPKLAEFPTKNYTIYIYNRSKNIKAAHNFYWVGYKIKQNISGENTLFNLSIDEPYDSIRCESCPLKDSVENINLLYGSNEEFTGIGKDSDNNLVVSDTKTLLFDKDIDDYFVASAENNKPEINWILITLIIVIIGIVIILLALKRKHK